MEAKLKAKLWIQAQIRTCMAEGVNATVARRGDPDSGAILVKLNRAALGCEVLTQVRDAAGALAWMRGTGPKPVPEAEADAYITRQVDRDWDLWVIEIEDVQGRAPLGGRILD